jgi:ketosteroid isomerase-like protein
MMQAQDTAALVRQYLTAFYTGDFEAAAEFLAEDFTFEGPFVKVSGRDDFLQSAQGLKPVVAGHRLLRQWEDGSDVSSIYEVLIVTPHKNGSVTMSEWHTVRGGKLASGRVLFDAAAFRALISQPA